MKELKSPTQAKNPAPKAAPLASHPPTMEQLKAMSTDELVKLLTSSELAQPANTAVLQQVITLLQEREGNDFARRVLGVLPGKEIV